MAEKKARRGEFQFILAVDCETTGLNVHSTDSSEGHQAISWGIVVADSKSFEPIEELYVEIKWNDDMKAKRAADPKFGVAAEKIHGLTLEYLEQNGISEAEAVAKIGELVLRYWGPSNSIRMLGHNVHLFDYKFFLRMFRNHGIEIPLANRHVDTSSIGLVTVGAFNSDELFETMGFEKRKEHNALDDVKMSLKACQIVNQLWKSKVGLLCGE